MPNKVSESEKSVMEVLWHQSPLSSIEIVKLLANKGWAEKTVKTFLNRLVKKGAVSYTKEGRRYLYEPVVKRDHFLQEQSANFLSKMFKGDMKELLATFVQSKQLSEDELEYLKGLLTQEQEK